jgi:sterol desaturase/sphingolipid hydroxylase (fatty acid hydroxylase superfamily)
VGIWLQYYVWLIGISLGCFVLERCFAWRKKQRVFRRQWAQDLFWLVFNGHYLGLLLAMFTGQVAQRFESLFVRFSLPPPSSWALLSEQPFWLQFLLVVLVKDFVEWNIHRLLHNVPWLWEFHKLHHSIEELDWAGNFRFHWAEVVVYKTLSYLPLVILGIHSHVLLAVAVLWTVALNLNHANIPFSWGPLRYVFNSSKMHVWHHDAVSHGRGGQNFGQVLSVWDWLFKTAYWPSDRDQPEKLGFEGMERYPSGLLARLAYPLTRRR